MKINGKAYRTIWLKEGAPETVQIIDQRFLPHRFVIEDLRTVDDMACAIEEMHLRGAPLIGAAAAFGMYLAALEAPSGSECEKFIRASAEKLKKTRPTAVNLQIAVDEQMKGLTKFTSKSDAVHRSLVTAKKFTEDEVERCRKIGEHGLPLIEAIYKKKKNIVNVLTHCNAGWLACVDWGTATAPIYMAHDAGIPVHVWVDETRPRNQGASLTAWELGQHKVPHTVVVDNAGGHLMQHGMVDLAIVGTDRTTATGDVANKIGTYLKALAAKDNGVPFYAAVPSSSIDWSLQDGVKEIPIEERDGEEVTHIQGMCDGEIVKVFLTPQNSRASNYGFDVTPRRLMTGLITERGVCDASRAGLLKLFPERK